MALSELQKVYCGEELTQQSEIAFLRNTTYEVYVSLYLNLNLGGMPTSLRIVEWLTVPKLYIVVYAECLLSFWESGILVCARERVPKLSAHNKNPGHCGSKERLW